MKNYLTSTLEAVPVTWRLPMTAFVAALAVVLLVMLLRGCQGCDPEPTGGYRVIKGSPIAGGSGSGRSDTAKTATAPGVTSTKSSDTLITRSTSVAKVKIQRAAPTSSHRGLYTLDTTTKVPVLGTSDTADVDARVSFNEETKQFDLSLIAVVPQEQKAIVNNNNDFIAPPPAPEPEPIVYEKEVQSPGQFWSAVAIGGLGVIALLLGISFFF